MNVSHDHSPMTLYKGLKLGEATPRHNVLLVDKNVAATQKYGLQAKDFDLDCTDLTPPEKTQLLDLLIQFAGLFTQTVKHSIPTEGRPMRQPLRRLPKHSVVSLMKRSLRCSSRAPSSCPWLSRNRVHPNHCLTPTRKWTT